MALLESLAFVASWNSSIVPKPWTFCWFSWCLHSKSGSCLEHGRGISKARHGTISTSRKRTHDVEVCCLYGK
jgi:hypothetical protein